MAGKNKFFFFFIPQNYTLFCHTQEQIGLIGQIAPEAAIFQPEIAHRTITPVTLLKTRFQNYNMKNSIDATYLGGPTVILEIGGLRIMTDPTLDPAGTTFMINDKPGYRKLEGPALTDIGKIDLVLLSHDQHGDNLDNAGRQLLKTVPLTLTTRIGAERLKDNVKGLAPWESTTVHTPSGEEIVITSTPARHGPAGVERLTGDVTGFIVSYGDRQLYITGDTVFYEGLAEVAKRFKPEYIFIFAGAAQPRGPFSVTMDTNDAIDTAFAFPESTLIPVHFEGWSHFTQSAESLQRSFTALGIIDRLMILPPGKSTNLPPTAS